MEANGSGENEKVAKKHEDFFILFYFIIYCTFVLATFVQLVYWLGLFIRLARYPNTSNRTFGISTPPVSIIICAKNEAKNLLNNLPSIIGQDYPDFEVVVVNDGSTDDTQQILEKFAAQYSFLKLINIDRAFANRPGKKFALTQGILAAKHEIVLLTDADCRPASRQWIEIMVGAIDDRIAIGLGYGPYWKDNTWLNSFIRYDTAYIAAQYFSFALAGMPYMGVGRNLIYKKKLFRQTNGFKRHQHIASGDDDLFISAAANCDNVEIILDEKAFVYSSPKKNWKLFYRQKVRHLSTGLYYNKAQKAFLGALSMSHFLHYTGGIVLILKFSTIFVIFIYVVRIWVVACVFGLILKRLKEQDLIKWIPLFDFCFVCYYLLFAPSLLIGKSEQWK